jgi:mannose-6-phosphate isomerase-like protein (cupin superfamily)
MASKAETLAGIPGADRPPEILSLRTQLVSEGHTKRLLAETDMMTLHVHCYGPKGGENGLHAHVEEDHVFVCLQGEAQFHGVDGPLPPLKKHQALFLPRGCFYSFSNEGELPLIMIRFGAGQKGYASARLDPDGKPIPGRAKQSGAAKPVLIEGAFFE